MNEQSFEQRIGEIQALRQLPDIPEDTREQLTAELQDLVVQIVHRGAVITTPEH